MERDGKVGVHMDGRVSRLEVIEGPTGRGSSYVSPSVILEFRARSTGEPASPREVVCDAAGFVEGVSFSAARPRVMHVERTFWEKATAAHVFCLQARLRGELCRIFP